MRGKIGAGHVEMVLSFVIFVGFLLFLFYIFNPFDLISNASLVDSVFFSMEENLSTEVSSISLSLSLEVVGTIADCFKIPDFVDVVEDLGCDDDINLIVKDKDGNIMESKSNSPSVSPNFWIELSGLTNNNDKRFYTIYCSEEINDGSTISVCNTQITETDYDLGILSNKQVWSRKNLNELASALDSSEVEYDRLKDNFISKRNDFGFKLWDLDDTSVEELKFGVPTEGVRVDARTIPIDVIEADGTVKKMTLTVLVW